MEILRNLIAIWAMQNGLSVEGITFEEEQT